jgi:hypothetical protein
VTPQDETLLRWAVQQGGAYVVILIVLFFYRRDWKTLNESARQDTQSLSQILIESTRVQVQNTAAVAENTLVTHRLKELLRDYLPSRRETD